MNNKVTELLKEINTTNLYALADWLDRKYENDPTPQVQADLRKWADNIIKALSLLPPLCPECCLIIKE